MKMRVKYWGLLEHSTVVLPRDLPRKPYCRAKAGYSLFHHRWVIWIVTHNACYAYFPLHSWFSTRLTNLILQNTNKFTDVQFDNIRIKTILNKLFNIIIRVFLFFASLYEFCALRYVFEDKWAWKVSNVYHVYEL